MTIALGARASQDSLTGQDQINAPGSVSSQPWSLYPPSLWGCVGTYLPTVVLA